MIRSCGMLLHRGIGMTWILHCYQVVITMMINNWAATSNAPMSATSNAPMSA